MGDVHLLIDQLDKNQGITRKWIRRFNFVQRTTVSGLSLKSQTRNLRLKVLETCRGVVLRSFTSWKNQSTSAGFDPKNLGFRGDHVTPRPSKLGVIKNKSIHIVNKWETRNANDRDHLPCKHVISVLMYGGPVSLFHWYHTVLIADSISLYVLF